MHLRIPARRLAWATDLHLNFVRGPEKELFVRRVQAERPDAVALTGDISDGRHLEADLSFLAARIEQPIFLVLGNHDRYHTSFSGAEQIVRAVTRRYTHVHRLTGKQLIELSPSTVLLGVDGWADGQAGRGIDSPIVLNDSVHIEDLADLPKTELFARMRQHAEANTETVAPTLREALSRYPEVILLTHVPPLTEAAWHEGRNSDADYLPHFSNPTLGKVLREACAEFPAAHLTVYCGHTHGSGVHTEGNLTVYTGPAIYGAPQVDRVIEIA